MTTTGPTLRHRPRPDRTRPGRAVTARIGSLFSGYGGLDLATEAVLGGRVAWHCENDPGASRILAAHWPGVPNHGDITAVDWRQVERVDVLTGGFPCQDVSHAGRRAGLAPGTRSGLWARMADAIDHLRPRLVVAENVRGLLSVSAASDVEPCPWCVGDGEGEPSLRALGAVLADLADLGYDAAWHGLRAADLGAPHARFRVFILAWPQSGHPDGIHRHRRAAAGQQGEAGPEAGSTADAHRLGRERPLQPRDGGLRPESSGRAAADAGRDARPEDDPNQRPVAGDRRTTANTDSDAVRQQPEPQSRRSSTPITGLPRADTPADSTGDRWDEWGTESARLIGGSDAAIGDDPAWGVYEPAIRLWEAVLGRPAPAPTEPGRGGAERISPRFVEWLMGLPAGWVTAVPGLTRNNQLKALGNGVVPQQAEAALRVLLGYLAEVAA